MDKFDLVVIGGGVIGAASLRASMERKPGLSACLLEVENDLAVHQSGRNSGVVHVGYNQKPGTMKAKFVVEGSRRLRAYCRDRRVPLVENGILIVARAEDEVDTLKELCARGRSNGARVELIDKHRLNEIEPYAAGAGALLAPEGASFDARSFVKSLFRDASDLGAESRFSEKVVNLRENSQVVEISTNSRTILAKLIVVAAGLHADTLAHMMGIGREYQVFPFRGDYYQLASGAELVKAHIYPAPNLKFPFLGVHLSRTFDDRVTVGPGALLALGKTCYSKFGLQPLDFCRMISKKSLWKLFSSDDFRTVAMQEWKKSLFPSEVLRESRLLVPSLEDGCLTTVPSGIRAQVVNSDGKMVDDLTVLETNRSIHVLNAVSPALTCSLPFADYIADLVYQKLRQEPGIFSIA